MADLGAIPQITSFQPDTDPISVSQRWKRWSDRFDNLLIAMNVTDNTRKKALLLHLAGENVFGIFSGLVLSDIPAGADPDVKLLHSGQNGTGQPFQSEKKRRV